MARRGDLTDLQGEVRGQISIRNAEGGTLTLNLRLRELEVVADALGLMGDDKTAAGSTKRIAKMLSGFIVAAYTEKSLPLSILKGATNG